MLYTKEQKEKLEKVIEVFQDYVRESLYACLCLLCLWLFGYNSPGHGFEYCKQYFHERVRQGEVKYSRSGTLC